jgi:phosphoribosylamine--glycine ligase
MLVEGRYGQAGRRVVLETALTGPEVSVFALCDGYNLRLLGAAQDHKRAFDGDRGPNTGGMGAFAPVPGLPDDFFATVNSQVLVPVLAGALEDGMPYRGFLYAGLMRTPDGVRVLEFNCRLGDPEAQVLLPRLQSDLLALLQAADAGDVTQAALAWQPGAAVGVVLAAPGYPDAPRMGEPLRGLDAARATGTQVFCAGVQTRGDGLVTRGGRICTVVGRGADIAAARRAAYAGIERLESPGAFYRRDIALQVAAPAPAH